MKQFIFNKSKTHLKSLHSFVRENFGEGVALESGDAFIVVADGTPRLSEPESVSTLNLGFQQGDLIESVCRLSFSNRGRRGSIVPINADGAMIKFLTASGLRAESASVTRVDDVVTKKFSVSNVFEINGTFTVEDPVKLKAAVERGVGSRRSYGFGLVLCQKIQPKEDSCEERYGTAG